MNRFMTLLRREWMQHHIGWLVLVLAPTVLILVLSLFDNGVQIRINDQSAGLPALRLQSALLQTALLSLAIGGLSFALACISVTFQLSGLARRDTQDRSIEFWSSLPVSHGQSVAAPLVAHVLLLPLAALLAGVLGAQVVALVTVVAGQGLLAWWGQPWWTLLPALMALLARLTLGLLLAAAWLSPFLLLTMAASAWLKRWGMPVVVVALVGGVTLLDKRLSSPLVGPAIQRLTTEAWQALLGPQALHNLQGLQPDLPDALPRLLQGLPRQLLQDAGTALAQAASPAFLMALLGGALGFALLVLRRQRGH